MNRYLLYLFSLFGIFIIIGSLITIKENKGNKIIYSWLIFGIVAQIIHIKMHLVRNNKNYDISSTISTLNNSVEPSISLICCTIGQLTVIFLYIYTRDLFHNKILFK